MEEGDNCPECNFGDMLYNKVEDCSCHIDPPCSACVENSLVCDNCGYEEGED